MIIHTSFSEIDKAQWKELVDASQTASFFQMPECYEFYDSLSFMKPFVVGVSEDNKLKGVLCGYLIAEGKGIKHYFSRRAIVPGGALLSGEISPSAVKALFKQLSTVLLHKAIYIEIRNFNDYTSFHEAIEAACFRYQPHLNIHVPLQEVESTFRGISESKQRQVRASQQAGVVWQETRDPEDVRAFYHILKQLYKTKAKIPLFPLEFFEKLVEMPGGKLLVVKYRQRVIGGMACAMLPGRTMYEWFVCGEERQEKDIYASVAATWAGLENAAVNKFTLFDFMGAGTPSKDYGVREFKRKFGGMLVEHGRFLYICRPMLYAIGKMGVRIIGRL